MSEKFTKILNEIRENYINCSETSCDLGSFTAQEYFRLRFTTGVNFYAEELKTEDERNAFLDAAKATGDYMTDDELFDYMTGVELFGNEEANRERQVVVEERFQVCFNEKKALRATKFNNLLEEIRSEAVKESYEFFIIKYPSSVDFVAGSLKTEKERDDFIAAARASYESFIMKYSYSVDFVAGSLKTEEERYDFISAARATGNYMTSEKMQEVFKNCSSYGIEHGYYQMKQ